MVVGNESPVTPKPAPVTVARFTTRLRLPEFVRVTFCVPVWLTVTFPKLMEEEESEKPVCMPTPLNGTENGALEALLLIARLPEMVPSAVGEKEIVRVDEPPALIVAGKVMPLRAKAGLVLEIEEMFRLALPELLKVTVIVPLLPTVTFPKLTLVLLSAS
jgi:hypothetical protein